VNHHAWWNRPFHIQILQVVQEHEITTLHEVKKRENLTGGRTEGSRKEYGYLFTLRQWGARKGFRQVA
jgi:hypothetical protein